MNLQLTQMQDFHYDKLIITDLYKEGVFVITGVVFDSQDSDIPANQKHYLFTQRNELREFKTLDSAYSIAKKLMYKRLSIITRGES